MSESASKETPAKETSAKETPAKEPSDTKWISELSANTIKNPLTIIGIFAGISQVFGSGVLPFLPKEIQATFVWFVMLFPVLLVLLFFAMLYFKREALYAPSDFKMDETFWGLIQNIRPQSLAEAKEKKQWEVNEGNEEHAKEDKIDPQRAVVGQFAAIPNLINNPKVEYFIAEELAVKKLTDEYGSNFLSEKTFEIRGNKFAVDGLINKPPELSIFEIKYFPRLHTPLNGIGKTIKYFEEIDRYIDRSKYKKVAFNIVIVTPIPKTEYKELLEKLDGCAKDSKMDLTFKIYDFEKLNTEFGI